jgi:hypothetical protein
MRRKRRGVAPKPRLPPRGVRLSERWRSIFTSAALREYAFTSRGSKMRFAPGPLTTTGRPSIHTTPRPSLRCT